MAEGEKSRIGLCGLAVMGQVRERETRERDATFPVCEPTPRVVTRASLHQFRRGEKKKKDVVAECTAYKSKIPKQQ